MNFVFKARIFAPNARNFALEMMNFAAEAELLRLVDGI